MDPHQRLVGAPLVSVQRSSTEAVLGGRHDCFFLFFFSSLGKIAGGEVWSSKLSIPKSELHRPGTIMNVSTEPNAATRLYFISVFRMFYFPSSKRQSTLYGIAVKIISFTQLAFEASDGMNGSGSFKTVEALITFHSFGKQILREQLDGQTCVKYSANCERRHYK